MVYWLTQMASWLAGKVPRRARLVVAGLVTTLVYYAWASKRRVTIANMEQVLGVPPNDPAARRLARQSWRNYGWYLSDFFHLPNTTPQDVLSHLIDVSEQGSAFDQINTELERGKGLLLVSPHFGAWDVAAVLAAAHTPLVALVDSFADPRMDKLIQDQRASFGITLTRADKSPRPILRALKENKAVAIVPDRPMPPGEGVPITFFGKRCYVPGGVAQIALLSGARVMTGACYYDERYSRTYYADITGPIHPESTGDRAADTIAMTQRIYDSFERLIREHPDQWYMFRRFWPENDADADGSARDTAAAGARVGAWAVEHD